MDYYIIALLWIFWCFLHSASITPRVTILFKKLLSTKYFYFRISYNIFALVTFILISRYKPIVDEEILFSFSGNWHIVQIALLIISVLFFVLGTKNYNMMQFIGVTQLTQKNTAQGIGEAGSFNQSGILQYTRHPWYVAIFILLWFGYIDLVYSKLIFNTVFSLYLIVGTILEEQKLVAEFGDEYKSFQQRVPMFLSLKSFTK